MGAPVVHFEITGTDGPALRAFYGELFGWSIATVGPMEYGLVDRAENLNPEGIGLGGGIAQGPEGYPGHVTVYVEVADVEASLQHAERLGARRMMGPEQVMEGVEIGLFTDPQGLVIGLIRGAGTMQAEVGGG